MARMTTRIARNGRETFALTPAEQTATITEQNSLIEQLKQS